MLRWFPPGDCLDFRWPRRARKSWGTAWRVQETPAEVTREQVVIIRILAMRQYYYHCHYRYHYHYDNNNNNGNNNDNVDNTNTNSYILPRQTARHRVSNTSQHKLHHTCRASQVTRVVLQPDLRTVLRFWISEGFLKQHIDVKGWDSHAHGEFPGSFESTNLSRDNRSREIGRTWLSSSAFAKRLSAVSFCFAFATLSVAWKPLPVSWVKPWTRQSGGFGAMPLLWNLRGTKGVPRKGVRTSVNVRAWACRELRAKRDQASCYLTTSISWGPP